MDHRGSANRTPTAYDGGGAERRIGDSMTKEQLKRINGLFHFTDRRNLPAIREHGGLFALAELKRREITIPAPGGNDWSHEEDVRRGLDEYVHLCFRWTHPMEYVARSEGRISDSVYLNVHPEVLRGRACCSRPTSRIRAACDRFRSMKPRT